MQLKYRSLEKNQTAMMEMHELEVNQVITLVEPYEWVSRPCRSGISPVGDAGQSDMSSAPLWKGVGTVKKIWK